MMKVASAKPLAKVSAATLAGALSTLAAWLVNLAGIDVPPAVEAALTTIIMAVIAYLTPIRPGEIVDES